MLLHKIRPFYYYIYTEVNEVVFEVIFASSSLLHLLLFKQRKRRIILHSAILIVAALPSDWTEMPLPLPSVIRNLVMEGDLVMCNDK
jgi:hypothetical protein